MAKLSIDVSNLNAMENKTIKMIMTIVGIFIFCNTFQVVYFAYAAFTGTVPKSIFLFCLTFCFFQIPFKMNPETNDASFENPHMGHQH